MFQDQSSDSVGFKSCWKTDKTSQNSEIQTEELSFKENEAQAVMSTHVETQTDAEATNAIAISDVDVDYDKLATFLNRICPKVLKELDRVHRSRAFDGYEPIEDDSDGKIKKLHILEPPRPEGENKVMVSGLCWSCTGSVVALSHSHLEHENWCDHSGHIHLYNINKLDFSPNVPSRSIEISTCISGLAAHPFEPSILAAATFSGGVLVWNLQQDEAVLLGSSANLAVGHREVVNQLCWVRNPDPTQHRPLLVSAGRDGRVMVWQVGVTTGSFKLHQGFLITLDQSVDKVQASPLGGSANTEVGVTCFTFSPKHPATFIVGVEGGGLLHCSLLTTKPATATGDIPLMDPVLSTYDSHQGAVTCVQCSPTLQVFLSCGTDKEIRVYNFNLPSPVQVIYPEAAVIGLEWHPNHTQLFAAWGEGDAIHIFNASTRKPTLQIKMDDKPEAVTTASFNQHSMRLMAAGDIRGRVLVCQLPILKPETAERT